MAEKTIIRVCEPVLNGNEKKYVLSCIDDNWISSEGKYVRKFEEEFSKFCGVRYGVACSSGTAALHLALKALNIGHGDEVIVPDFNLIAGCNMVILSGAKPVLVDVDRDTMGISASLIEEKITSKTKAIMVVHMYGHPCDMKNIMAIANKYDLAVIEDCAQAHGAQVDGKRVGSFGDVATFSFYANKIITTGEGGMVVTNNQEIAERLKLLRNQGFQEPRFIHNVCGYNYRLTNLQAAIGLAQLEKIEEKINKKIQIANWYNKYLKDVKGLILPKTYSWAKNVYWMYTVILTPEFGKTKDQVMQYLKDKGIQTRSLFYPMHKQPCFQNSNDPRFPDITGNYPVSEWLYDNGFYLPTGENLTESQVEKIATVLISAKES